MAEPHTSPRRADCPDCERASVDNHDFFCTRGARCVERPRPTEIGPFADAVEVATFVALATLIDVDNEENPYS